MYVFDLWFKDSRERIARAETRAAFDEALAHVPAYLHPAIEASFEAAVQKVAHNIHPLVLLGLRRKL